MNEVHSVFRPHLKLSHDARGAHGRLQEVHLPHLDEDECTMAVEAAVPCLASAGVDPAKLAAIRVTSRTGRGWAQDAALAIGARGVPIEELSGDEFHARQEQAPHDGPAVLWIRSDAPRPASPGPATDVAAEAVARLSGSGLRGSPDLEPGAHRPPRVVDAAFVERLVAWETRALATVPMGANISQAAWDVAKEARYRLLASRCEHCRASHHPPLSPCGRCGNPTKVEPLPRIGTLYSHTSIAKGGGPSEFDAWQDLEGEYGVAVIEFRNEVRTVGMVTETPLAALRVGLPMEPVLRRLYAQDGRWRYGIKFRGTGDGRP